MGTSALSGVFREFTCTYQVEDGTWTTDAYGNSVPNTTSAQLTINFEASRSPQVIFAEGADPKVVRGRGSCINPSELPTPLGPGSELDMTWNGVAGKLRILQVTLSPLSVLDEVLGTEFIAEWRAT